MDDHSKQKSLPIRPPRSPLPVPSMWHSLESSTTPTLEDPLSVAWHNNPEPHAVLNALIQNTQPTKQHYKAFEAHWNAREKSSIEFESKQASNEKEYQTHERTQLPLGNAHESLERMLQYQIEMLGLESLAEAESGPPHLPPASQCMYQPAGTCHPSLPGSTSSESPPQGSRPTSVNVNPMPLTLEQSDGNTVIPSQSKEPLDFEESYEAWHDSLYSYDIPASCMKVDRPCGVSKKDSKDDSDVPAACFSSVSRRPNAAEEMQNRISSLDPDEFPNKLYAAEMAKYQEQRQPLNRYLDNLKSFYTKPEPVTPFSDAKNFDYSSSYLQPQYAPQNGPCHPLPSYCSPIIYPYPVMETNPLSLEPLICNGSNGLPSPLSYSSFPPIPQNSIYEAKAVHPVSFISEDMQAPKMDSSKVRMPSLAKILKDEPPVVDTASTTDVPAITMDMKGTPGIGSFSTTKVSGAIIAATADTRKASRAKAHKNAKIWPKSSIATKSPCNDPPTVFEASNTNSPADVITKSSTAANPLSISKPDSKPTVRYTDSRGLLAPYYTPPSYKDSSTEALTPSAPVKSSRPASAEAPSTSASTPATSLDSNESVPAKAPSTKAHTPAKPQSKEYPLSDLLGIYKKMDTSNSPICNFHATEVRSMNARIPSTPRPKKLRVSKPKWDSESILERTAAKIGSAETPETPRMKPLRDIPIPLLDLGDEPWEYIFEEDVNDWEIVKKEGTYCWGLDQARMGS